YFDPASGEYKTASTPRTTITISPAPTPATGSATTAPVVSSDTNDKSPTGDGTRSEAKSPAAPRGIPREPLEGSTTAMVPLSVERLMTLTLLPFALLPLLWGWFAL